jgi:KDO2-lipid IV(A) lauroyltransferase
MAKQGRGFFVVFISIIGVGVLSLLSWVTFRILTAAGAGLGSLYYHLDGKRKKIGLSNPRLAFGESKPEKELKDILKSVYKQMGSSMLEFAALPRLNKEKLDGLVRFEGLDKIEAERKAGRGVILLNGHIGNWELYTQSAAIHGERIHMIGREANVGLLHNFMVRCRESKGNRVILRKNAMRKILTVLKEGGVLGVMCDQRGSTSRGLMIDFFSHPAPTNPAIARMILKSGAAIMTSFGVRNPDQTHTVTISDPIQIDHSQDLQKDVLQLTQNYTKILEDFIREHPDQWLWMHRRWMRRN